MGREDEATVAGTGESGSPVGSCPHTLRDHELPLNGQEVVFVFPHFTGFEAFGHWLLCLMTRIAQIVCLAFQGTAPEYLQPSSPVASQWKRETTRLFTPVNN